MCRAPIIRFRKFPALLNFYRQVHCYNPQKDTDNRQASEQAYRGYSFVRTSERIDGMDRKKCSSLVLLLVVLCRVGNLGFIPLDRAMLAVVKEES